MNLLRYELKCNAKGFALWAVTLVALVVIGGMKYTGIAGAEGDSMQQMLQYYPAVVLALFGISPEVDVMSLSGYNWILCYYVVLCGCIYAITLGTAVVNRELGDKTYEFLFTKPRGRGYLLTMKLVGGLIPLTLFSGLNYLCAMGAIDALETTEDIMGEIALGGLAVYLLSVLFFALAFFVATAVRERGMAGKILYGLFALFFALGAVCDVMEDGAVLRPFVPLRYFSYADVSGGALSGGYVALTLALTVAAVAGGYFLFGKKDLTAV